MWDNEGNGKLNRADFELPISAFEADWGKRGMLALSTIDSHQISCNHQYN